MKILKNKSLMKILRIALRIKMIWKISVKKIIQNLNVIMEFNEDSNKDGEEQDLDEENYIEDFSPEDMNEENFQDQQ